MKIQIRKELIAGKMGWNAYEVIDPTIGDRGLRFIPATSLQSAEVCEYTAREFLQRERMLPVVEREFTWPDDDGEAQALDDAAAEGECFSEALRQDNPVR